MSNQLYNILKKEEEAIGELLLVLEKQHTKILKNDPIELNMVTDEIQLINKKVAEAEVARRKLVGNKKITELMTNDNSKEIDRVLRDIKILLTNIQLQKDTNDLLIKQQLSYTNKILSIINPRRDVKTYNSYGKI